MVTNETILHSYKSTSRVDGSIVLFEIISRPTGGRHWYPEYIKKLDKLIFIRLTKNGSTIEYPFREDDPMLLWDSMVDVWVKKEKKQYYVDKFLSFILKKQCELE